MDRPLLHTPTAAAPDATAPRPRGQHLRGFRLGLAFCAATFGMFTVFIHVADAVTNYFVAVQFYREQRMTWFWLVVSMLGVSTFVCALTVAEVMPASREWQAIGWTDNIPRVVRWLVGVVIAPVAPIVHLYLCKRCEWQAARSAAFRERVAKSYGAAEDNDIDMDAEGTDEDQQRNRSVERQLSDTWVTLDVNKGLLSRAGVDELHAVELSVLLHERMAAAFETHLRQFSLFYVDSAVAAAPQAVIQLLAITFLGRASWIQLVSLCCSLLSITTKGFIISRSIDARVMAFKFFLAAHDVFSTFYLFSTIVAAETRKDTSFFGLEVSWLGYIWLWKIVLCVVIMITLGIFIGVNEIRRNSFSRSSRLRVMRNIFFVTVLALVVSVPLGVAFECMKLSVANIVLTLLESEVGYSSHKSIALVVSFLDRDDNEQSRLRHLVTSLIERAAMRIAGHRDAALAVRPDSCGVPRVHAAALVAQHMDPTVMGLSMQKSLADAVYDTMIDSWASMLQGIALGSGALIVAVGAVFSTAYPLANASRQYQSHNVLLFACCVTLILAPASYRFGRVCHALGPFFQRVDAPVAVVAAVVAAYHEPPHVQLLKATVATAVMPSELVALVSRFLEPGDIITEFSLAEAEEWRRRREARDDEESRP